MQKGKYQTITEHKRNENTRNDRKLKDTNRNEQQDT